MMTDSICTNQNLFLENWIRKILWDLTIQVDYQLYKKTWLRVEKKKNNNNKKTSHLVNIAVRANYRVKMKETERIEKISGSCQRAKKKKKAVEHEVDGKINVVGVLRTVQIWKKDLRLLVIRRGIETIQIIAPLRFVRIFRILEPLTCQSYHQWKTTS